MNTYMRAQIVNMQSMIKTFCQSCKMAAGMDDGRISKEEEKQLKEIEKCCSKFSESLEKILR